MAAEYAKSGQRDNPAYKYGLYQREYIALYPKNSRSHIRYYTALTVSRCCNISSLLMHKRRENSKHKIRNSSVVLEGLCRPPPIVEHQMLCPRDALLRPCHEEQRECLYTISDDIQQLTTHSHGIFRNGTLTACSPQSLS